MTDTIGDNQRERLPVEFWASGRGGAVEALVSVRGVGESDESVSRFKAC
jgi:hypothetical protein